MRRRFQVLCRICYVYSNSLLSLPVFRDNLERNKIQTQGILEIEFLSLKIINLLCSQNTRIATLNYARKLFEYISNNSEINYNNLINKSIIYQVLPPWMTQSFTTSFFFNNSITKKNDRYFLQFISPELKIKTTCHTKHGLYLYTKITLHPSCNK